MTRLFIEIYLDEDVDVLVADLLRHRGFSATTTVEEGKRGNTDAEQMAYATARGKAILTHNRRDFEALVQTYFLSGEDHHGVILAVRRVAQEIVRRLLIILNDMTADEMKNQVKYI
jgi:predicted nuclease of predicted toxin-antitoxin system